MPSAPVQPQRERDAYAQERNKASHGADDLRDVDDPIGSVIDEPSQYRLIVGNEAASIEHVPGDQHE